MIKKLLIFDFDGTLIDTKWNTLKQLYKEKTGVEWKIVGFRRNPESLRDDLFDFQLINETYQDYLSYKGGNDNLKVLLTGRQETLRPQVEHLLNKFDLKFDKVLLNPGFLDTFAFKLREINKLIKEYDSIEEIEIWEDRVDHLIKFKEHIYLHHPTKIIKDNFVKR